MGCILYDDVTTCIISIIIGNFERDWLKESCDEYILELLVLNKNHELQTLKI